MSSRILRPVLCPVLCPVLQTVWGSCCDGEAGEAPCVATASTVDEFGADSRLHVTMCACDTPSPVGGIPGEDDYNDVTLTVNDSSVGWSLGGYTTDGNCVTWDVTGGPLSYGDTITITLGSDWVEPPGDTVISVTNTIAAPLQLLTLPAFDATTGRLDEGDYYNTRTSTNSTFENSDSKVETVLDARLIYDGARVVQNRIGEVTSLTDTEDLSAGWYGVAGATITGTNTVNMAADLWNCKWRTNTAISGDFNGKPICFSLVMSVASGTELIRLEASHTGDTGYLTDNLTVTTTPQRFSLIVTPTGSGTGVALSIHQALNDKVDKSIICTEVQFEDLSAKSVQDAPGEYESVGVGVGDEKWSDTPTSVEASWTDNGDGSYTCVGGAGPHVIEDVDPGVLLDDHYYRVEFTVTGYAAGLFRVTLYGQDDYGVTSYATANGDYVLFTTINNDTGTYPNHILLQSTGTFEGTVSNISIKQASTGYGIYNRANANSVDANGVVDESTPGDVLATAPTLRHAPAATNLIGDSNDFTAWTKGSYTVNANQDTAPDGSSGADEIVFTIAWGYVRYACTVIASTDYIFHFYAKRGTAAEAKYSVYDLTNGADIVSPTSYYSEINGSDYVRVDVPFTTPAGCISAGVYVARDFADDGGNMYVWGAQLEIGTVATPYIATSGGTETRLIDSILYPYSAGVFDPDEGSLYIKLKLAVDTDDQVGLPDSALFNLLNIYGGNGRIIYNPVASGSVLSGYHGLGGMNNPHVNIPAGDIIEFIVTWSKSSSKHHSCVKIGAVYDHSAIDATFNGWTASDYIGLFVAFGAVGTIEDMEVIDSYLTTDGIEARYP